MFSALFFFFLSKYLYLKHRVNLKFTSFLVMYYHCHFLLQVLHFDNVTEVGDAIDSQVEK